MLQTLSPFPQTIWSGLFVAGYDASVIPHLRWMFTLFGADLAISILYKKTFLKEVLAKVMYQNEEYLFCNTSMLIYYRNTISIL